MFAWKRKSSAAALAGLALCLSAPVSADVGKWENLLSGDNLKRWTPKFAGSVLGENYKDTFSVSEAGIKVSYDAYTDFKGEFGHLFYSVPYSSYRLRFDYRFTGEQTPGGPGWAFRNSGVMVHSQAPQSMTVAQEFPVSIEVQLLGQTGERKRPTGNMCSPGTHVVIDGTLEKEHCIYSSSETFRGDGWVTAEVEVRADKSITHYINGTEVMTYTAPQLDPTEVDTQNILKGQGLALTEGYIAFQAESHPVEFRNIQLQLIKE